MVDIEKYKVRLTAMLEQLTSELKTIGIHNPNNPSDWIARPEALGNTEADLNVAADRVEDWDERRSTVAVLETRYNNIVRALAKIEEGTFGICEISNEEIEIDRLEANPTARTNKAHLEEESSLPQ